MKLLTHCPACKNALLEAVYYDLHTFTCNCYTLFYQSYNKNNNNLYIKLNINDYSIVFVQSDNLTFVKNCHDHQITCKINNTNLFNTLVSDFNHFKNKVNNLILLS